MKALYIQPRVTIKRIDQRLMLTYSDDTYADPNLEVESVDIPFDIEEEEQ